VRKVTRGQTCNWSSQSLSRLLCTSLASLKSGVSGPWMACSGGVEVSTAAFRFIEYGLPRRDDGLGGSLSESVSWPKTKPTRDKINKAAARIVGVG